MNDSQLDVLSRPYEAFAQLRDAGPAHLLRFPDGIERWLVTRYEDVAAVLGDPRFSSDSVGEPDQLDPEFAEQLGRVNAVFSHGMTNQDPPEHTRLRKLVVGAFSARRVERLRPRIQQLTDILLDALEGQAATSADGVVDLVDGFALPLPVMVICELMGVPAQDRDRFRAWSQALMTFVTDTSAGEQAAVAAEALYGYFLDLAQDRRERPRDDLISAMVAAQEDDRLTNEELAASGITLLIAGHETTVQLLASGTLNLLGQPDQLDLVRTQPDLLIAAVNELLRYDGPVNPGVLRRTLADVEVGGVTIPAESFVIVGLASANRDEHRFAEADRIDITRADNRHLAFGHGIHYCLGARLAQVEGEIALGTLLRRFPRLRLAAPADSLRWRPGFIRSLTELPVRLG